MKNLDTICRGAVLKAGAFAREHAFASNGLEWKKYDDPVTKVDRRVEKLLHQKLSGLDAAFISEESGYSENFGYDKKKSDYCFIIDPIDGTKSYVRHDFLSSVSLAVEKEHTLIAGYVYDFMKDILYAAFEGEKYIMHQQQKIEWTPRAPLPKISMAVDNESISFLRHVDRYMADPLNKLYPISIQRRGGSLALSMAQLAAGNFDALIMFPQGKGNIWDVAAGQYILHCENIPLYDIAGEPFDYRHNGQNGLIAVRGEHDGQVWRVLNAAQRLRRRYLNHTKSATA